MAKKGLKHVVFAELTSAGAYTNAKHISPAVRVSVSLTKAEGKDYGDDVVVDSESAVTGGTVEVELNHDEDDIYTFLLGHKEDSVGNEIKYNTDDEPPIVGMGYIQNATLTDGRRWIAEWIYQVKFSEPDEEANTKTDSVSFQHTTITGDMMVQGDGNWKRRKVFTTASAAIAWVDAIASGTEG